MVLIILIISWALFWLYFILDSSYLERSEEISEIDARLRALQEFMKKSLEPNKHRKK